MQGKSKLTLKIFVLCFLFNGILLATLYAVGDRHVQGALAQVETAVSGLGATDLPEAARSALTTLGGALEEQRRSMLPAILGLGGGITLLLACAAHLVARGALKRALTGVGTSAGAEKKGGAAGKKAGKEPAEPPKKEPARASPYPAVQILSALQREGRLMDFLQEDLGPYEDAQIGAAVRSVHEGCKKALSEHLELVPVFQQEEGAEVTVKKGFDARAVRLTGNVAGDPPFRGVLRHRGWQVARLDLPVPVADLLGEKTWVLAPAEVEIEG